MATLNFPKDQKESGLMTERISSGTGPIMFDMGTGETDKPMLDNDFEKFFIQKYGKTIETQTKIEPVHSIGIGCGDDMAIKMDT